MAVKFTRLMNFFKSDSQRGTYLSGKALNDITIKKGSRLYVFPNEYKRAKNDPDFNLCIKED